MQHKKPEVKNNIVIIIFLYYIFSYNTAMN